MTSYFARHWSVACAWALMTCTASLTCTGFAWGAERTAPEWKPSRPAAATPVATRKKVPATNVQRPPVNTNTAREPARDPAPRYEEMAPTPRRMPASATQHTAARPTNHRQAVRQVQYEGPVSYGPPVQGPYYGPMGNHGEPMMMDGEEVIVDEQETWLQEDEALMHGGHHAGCDANGCCADECSNWILPDRGEMSWDACDACRNWCWAQDLSFIVGAHAFQGPVDLGINGNFGFHYGVNYGMPLWHRYGIGMQMGAQAVHSNLNGQEAPDGVSGVGEPRTQAFVSLGLFRRNWEDTCGWQWAVTCDWMHDSYYDSISLLQIRDETSYRINQKHEIGFWTAVGISEDSVTDQLTNATLVSVPAEQNNQYNLFYRYHFAIGGEGRIWGGFTDSGDGLIGGDTFFPLSDISALTLSMNYMIPKEDTTTSGADRQSWALGFNLAIYPARTALMATKSRYRPVLHVADNATFFTKR